MLLLGGGVLLLLFGLNMRRGLNHDEQQFVASGVLLARYGLRPYADFAYFHVPAQTLLYGLLFRLFDQFLLTARVTSVLAGWLSLALILLLAVAYAPFRKAWSRLGFGAALLLLLLATPLFVHTSGRAWNHDLPLLLTLLGFVAALQALAMEPARRATGFWLVAAGACLGLAAATRLSYAFLAPAFVAALWLRPGWPARRKGTATLWLALGGLVGMLPVWVLWLEAPQEFWFGNVVYNLRLNPLYYNAVGDGSAMTLAAKLGYLVELTLARPANLLLPGLFALAVVPVLARISRRNAPGLVLVLLCLPFALAGALSATPSQPQYYFVLYPFLALGVIFAAALRRAPARLLGGAAGVAAALAVVASVVPYAEGAEVVFQPARWYPVKAHARGQLIRTLVGRGQVLTMAPIHALEGGVPIYPEFVTGPLAWRVAPFLTPKERARFRLTSEADFASLVALAPPRGILVGFESSDRDFEATLLDYARDQGYVPVALPDEGELWLRPLAAWNGAIRLGAHTLPRQAVAPGSTLDVTFYEQKFGPIARNLNVLVRVVGADGAEIARSEGWPFGSATANWPDGAVWPDGHRLALADGAPPGFYRVEMSFYDPSTLETFGEPATVGYLAVGMGPAPAGSLAQASFADGVRLLSAALPAAALHPGATAQLELVWQAVQPVAGRYTAFVHLLDPAGQLVAQSDRPPLGGFYPTDAWLAGFPVADSYALTLPADLAPGTYRAVAGLYDPTTGQRLPLADGGDAVELGALEIAAP